MREIINLQIGHCGNSLGLQLLSTIAQQHGVAQDGQYIGTSHLQRSHIETFFNQHPQNMFTTRTILADLEPGSIDQARASSRGKIYNPDNFVVGLGSAGNNWGVGHYQKGPQFNDILMDAVRRESQNCDHLEGFQLLHSIGGGTGSGWGSLILEKLREQFPDRMIQTFTVFPSSKQSDIVVDSYNATLASFSLVQHPEMVHIFQNEALYDICQKKMRLEHPSSRTINEVIARTAAGTTCGMRFPGQANSNLRKQAVNLVPFPRPHFFMDSISPLTPLQNRTRKYNVSEIMTELYDKSSFMTSADPCQGRFMTASAIFRGNVSTSEAEEECHKIVSKNSSYFFEWIPSNIGCSVCNMGLPGQPLGGLMIGNSTAIQSVFKTLGQNFTAMFRRRAYLHWYTGVGMDEMEFTEAESNMNDLVSEYQPCCGCCQEDGDFDEEEEEQKPIKY